MTPSFLATLIDRSEAIRRLAFWRERKGQLLQQPNGRIRRRRQLRRPERSAADDEVPLLSFVIIEVCVHFFCVYMNVSAVCVSTQGLACACACACVSAHACKALLCVCVYVCTYIQTCQLACQGVRGQVPSGLFIFSFIEMQD